MADVDVIFLILLTGLICIILINTWIKYCTEGKYSFNSAYDRTSDPNSQADIKEPCFTIEKIESVYTSNGFKELAKYTCRCSYLTSKSGSRINTYVFYGETNEYQIGDVIYFTKY